MIPSAFFCWNYGQKKLPFLRVFLIHPDITDILRERFHEINFKIQKSLQVTSTKFQVI